MPKKLIVFTHKWLHYLQKTEQNIKTMHKMIKNRYKAFLMIVNGINKCSINCGVTLFTSL